MMTDIGMGEVEDTGRGFCGEWWADFGTVRGLGGAADGCRLGDLRELERILVRKSTTFLRSATFFWGARLYE